MLYINALIFLANLSLKCPIVVLFLLEHVIGYRSDLTLCLPRCNEYNSCVNHMILAIQTTQHIMCMISIIWFLQYLIAKCLPKTTNHQTYIKQTKIVLSSSPTGHYCFLFCLVFWHFFLNFLFNLGRSFSVHVLPWFPGWGVQTGITLIGNDCEVFDIHCIRPTSQIP